MITLDNIKDLLSALGFQSSESGHNVMSFHFDNLNDSIIVDFDNEEITYPKGLEAERDTTKNFSKNENFVVLECVYGLLCQGYKPEHIVLEPKTPGGREDSYFWGDILIRDNNKRTYMLIECKTMNGEETDEFNAAWKKTLLNGSQLFNYFNSYRQAQYLALYASDFVDGEPRYAYRLISMIDNKDYLKSNPKLYSYEQVALDKGDRDEYFRVWSETYGKDYSTNGAFEVNDVPAFGVGKKKLYRDALQIIDEQDIQKKYNEFAQILRKYNVSGHENAFDKLVNLFLVKVVDESTNPDDLQFIWKGAAYDDYYSFQDRLQKMYQTGMKDYLGEVVTYIDNATIENAFKLQKNDPDSIKETIMDYFRQLKFYSSSDFGFLDVHNKQLFLQNSVILKEMVEMLQNIRLITDKPNQFLGDLFENFLDQGVKQNEGQYFTPTPITRFIVSSLPLFQKIVDSPSIPKVIDYACGAGHFLNEYAIQIKPIVSKHKGKSYIHSYNSNIYGIEKENRLSKVTKVSSIMYGNDGIQVVYGDALSKHAKIEDGTFDILIANPPYSVPGFLNTLSKEERNSFELGKLIKDKSLDSIGFIESFFIERAKQLLAPNGIAAIILPFTVLAGDEFLYEKTREIILQYFEICAIGHFGDGTFGRTGTNTAVLFMTRRANEPEYAHHCKIRVNAWFNNDHSQDKRYCDENIIDEYAAHIGIPASDYRSFVDNTNCDAFSQSEIYQAYVEAFSKDSTAKEIRNKKITLKYTIEDQKKDLEKHIVDSIRSIENDKLYYYMLCRSNKDIIIVESPISEGKKDKREQEFLGYYWSTAKGREGIHYITEEVISESKENNTGQEQEDDQKIAGSNKGIKAVKTPLFNPSNLYEQNKINSIIRSNFLGESVAISEELSNFVRTSKLVDLIDFSHVKFDKSINITPQHNIEINSDFECLKLEKLITLNDFTYNPSKSDSEYIYVDISSVEKKTGNIDYTNVIIGNKAPSRARRLAKDKSLLISTVRPNLRGFAYIESEISNAIFSTGFAVIRSKDESILRPKYLYYLFMYLDIVMEQIKALMPKGAYPSINDNDIKKIKIPLAPIEIQDSVILAIDKIEQQFARTRMKIEDRDKKVSKIMIDNRVVNS